ncbi:unnamed protein product [Adineta steineri]|uniref:Uncharacterized protein n=1 Tax=Adineta steineri TaxID=433720 RepID=A0A815LLE0_9BILA|nr:unnamed protein product [Adineta steineri]CAF1615511.1 unnamed protein product [Adineta steineri]
MNTSTIFPSSDYNDVIVDTPTIPSKREQRLDKAINYFSSVMFAIQVILAAVFSGIELHYGIDYLNQCPIQPWINIFLIVHGSTKLAWVLLGIVSFFNGRVIYNMMNKKTLARSIIILILPLQLLFALWFLAWFIVGNVWVFSCKSRVQYTDPTNTSTYCQQTLYSAAYGLIISTYIVVGIVAILTVKRRVIGKTIRQRISS